MISPPRPRSSSAPAPATAKRGRPQPQRVPELAHLTLGQLRVYRRELQAEESRVSYWRRLLQARVDLAVDHDDEPVLRRLRGILSRHQAASRRLAMLPVQLDPCQPPLPDLAVLWQTQVDGDTADGLATRLVAAEAELSSYRRSLHLRLDTATGELIARYREDPTLALTALPLPVNGSDVA